MTRERSLSRKQVAMELMLGHRLKPGVGFFPSASALPYGWHVAIDRELAERDAGRGLPTYKQFIKAKKKAARLW